MIQIGGFCEAWPWLRRSPRTLDFDFNEFGSVGAS